MSPKGGTRVGAGRRPLFGEKMETLSVQLPGPTVAQLNSEADAQGISLQALIRERLAQAKPPQERRLEGEAG